jgi:hypothetical protein
MDLRRSRRLSSRLLIDESFAPTRLARTPLVVGSWRWRLDRPLPPARGDAARRLRIHLSGPLALSQPRPRATRSRGRLRAVPSRSRGSSADGDARSREQPHWSRAASRAPPRRGARSAAPEMPLVGGPPLSGCGVIHRMSPTCGLPRTPFQSALEPMPLTRHAEEWTRSPCHRSAHPWVGRRGREPQRPQRLLRSG